MSEFAGGSLVNLLIFLIEVSKPKQLVPNIEIEFVQRCPPQKKEVELIAHIPATETSPAETMTVLQCESNTLTDDAVVANNGKEIEVLGSKEDQEFVCFLLESRIGVLR